MTTLFFTSYLLIVTGTFWLKYRAGHGVDIIPSLLWLLMMVLPFMGQKATFSPIHANSQAIGILIIGFALLIGDYLSSQWINKVALPLDERKMLYVGYSLYVLILGIQLFHLSLMPQVPLFEWLWGSPKDPIAYAEMREQSSKLLHIPIWFQHAFQLSIVLGAPLTLAIFYSYRKYYLVSLLLITTLIYSYATLARLPMALFGAICIMVYIRSLTNYWRLRLGLIILLLLTPVFICAGHFLFFNPGSVFNYRLPSDPVTWVERNSTIPVSESMKQNLRTQPFTITDHHRCLDLNLNKQAGSFGRAINYMMYRAFLVPVEVSHRWYIYYPQIHGSHLGLYGLTQSSRSDPNFQHPANKVAIWAYVSRFPHLYLQSSHAYASVDADAWARWGYAGIVAVAFFLFVLRFIAGNVRLEGRLGDAVYTAFLTLFSLSLPIASLQAVLHVQGVLYFCLIPVVFWIWNTLRKKYRSPKEIFIREQG